MEYLIGAGVGWALTMSTMLFAWWMENKRRTWPYVDRRKANNYYEDWESDFGGTFANTGEADWDAQVSYTESDDLRDYVTTQSALTFDEDETIEERLEKLRARQEPMDVSDLDDEPEATLFDELPDSLQDMLQDARIEPQEDAGAPGKRPWPKDPTKNRPVRRDEAGRRI